MLVADARSSSRVVPEVGWACAVLENKAFYVRAWIENVHACVENVRTCVENGHT